MFFRTILPLLILLFLLVILPLWWWLGQEMEWDGWHKNHPPKGSESLAQDTQIED